MSGVLDNMLGGDLYKVLRLVMVNSASAAYVEIPLDKTSALLSKNNKGKTSALNALKLFLLPEVNFKDCKNKFGFSSGGTVYSDLESFNYYFPSSTSFIVLEATNVGGDFCIILHQTPRSELGYSRIAIPQPYETIRHLFWDINSKGNSGLGSHPLGMNLSDTQKCLKLAGGIQLNDQASISAALYTRVTPTKPETKFCIMPLVQQPKPAMMRSIKSLLQLSFDIKGADKKNLPLAIANIIDSDVSVSRDPINIDFKKIQADRQRLRQDAKHIQLLRNNRDSWNKLVEAFNCQGVQHELWLKTYNQLSDMVVTLIDQHQPRYLEADTVYQEIIKKRKNIQSKKNENSNSLMKLKGEYNSVKKELDNLLASIELAREVISREKIVTNNNDALKIAQHLSSIKVEYETELDTLKSQIKSENRLAQLLSDLPKKNAKIKFIEEKLQSDKESLLSHLTPKSALILNSINSDFEYLTSHPMDSQINDLENFAGLFHSDGDCVELFGEVMPNTKVRKFSNDSLKEKLKGQLEEFISERKKMDIEISNLNRILKSSGPLTETIINNKEDEIREITREIRSVSSLEQNEILAENKEIEKSRLEEEKEKIEMLTQELGEKYLDFSNQEENARLHMESVKRDYNLIRDAEKDLKRARTIATDIAISVNSKISRIDISPSDLQNRINELDCIYDDFRSRKQQAISQFRILVSANISAIDPDFVHDVDLKSMEFYDAYQKLRSEFDNLETKEKEHLSQVRNHNHETSVEISMLDSMARAITNFENRINLELEDIQVSNLSSVKMQIKTLDGFNTLRRELENHGTTSDQLMDDSFYERLTQFCEKYLTDGNRYGKLNLEKIITNVKFIYEMNGQKESTSQSNGTNGMVNAVLLAILMRRLVPEDVTFTLPVIFDEVGSLDEDNLPELRRVVESNHFILLVANPNNNGYIAQHIGRWHDIYLYQLSEGRAIGKCLAVYLSETESLEPVKSDGSSLAEPLSVESNPT